MADMITQVLTYRDIKRARRLRRIYMRQIAEGKRLGIFDFRYTPKKVGFWKGLWNAIIGQQEWDVQCIERPVVKPTSAGEAE